MKQCSKCKEWKDESEYHKDKTTKDKLDSKCKLCKKLYYESRKDIVKEVSRLYYLNNKDHILERNHAWRQNNLEYMSLFQKNYRAERKDHIKEVSAQYNLKNKHLNSDRNKSSYKKLATYKTNHLKLTVDDFPRVAEDGHHLEVKCKYCGEYFIPTNGQVKQRHQALRREKDGEGAFYCSTNCKKACPIFKKQKHYANSEKAKHQPSREVQAELRQMVFELDEWECQRCGATTQEAELHCHHLTGVELNPIESADVDNCITLCEFHHDELHKRKGCTYNDFRRKACVTEES